MVRCDHRRSAPDVRIAVWLAAAVLVLEAGRADAADGDKKTSVAVVPGPFYNPNNGLGVMLMPLVMFHPSENDTVSPPSIVALFGMYAVLPPLSEASTSYSWATGSAARLYLDEDRWRVQLAFLYLDMFREFHGIGGDPSSGPLFDYRQAGAIAFAQVMREVGVKHLYAGLIGGYTVFRSQTSDPNNQSVLNSLGGGSDWEGQPVFGVSTQFDNRDNQYYPSSGMDLNLRATGSFKSGDQFGVVIPSFSQYFAL